MTWNCVLVQKHSIKGIKFGSVIIWRTPLWNSSHIIPRILIILYFEFFQLCFFRFLKNKIQRRKRASAKKSWSDVKKLREPKSGKLGVLSYIWRYCQENVSKFRTQRSTDETELFSIKVPYFLITPYLSNRIVCTV